MSAEQILELHENIAEARKEIKEHEDAALQALAHRRFAFGLKLLFGKLPEEKEEEWEAGPPMVKLDEAPAAV